MCRAPHWLEQASWELLSRWNLWLSRLGWTMPSREPHAGFVPHKTSWWTQLVHRQSARHGRCSLQAVNGVEPLCIWKNYGNGYFRTLENVCTNMQSTTVLISFFQIQVLPLLKRLSSYKLIFKNSSLKSQIPLVQCLKDREHFGSSITPTTLEVWYLPFIKSPMHQPL